MVFVAIFFFLGLLLINILSVVAALLVIFVMVLVVGCVVIR